MTASASIVVASIAALASIVATVMSVRAQRRGAEATEKASVIEGYDELTHHLSAVVQGLEGKVARLEGDNEAQANELRHLHVENDQQATRIRVLEAQLDVVRAYLGQPTGWDPRFDGVRRYGRRAEDGPDLPDGHTWANPETPDPPPTGAPP